MIDVEQREGLVRFRVRVQPRAGRTQIAGEWQGALRVRLAAPPVDDRANDALLRFLAERLGIAASAIRIVSGRRSRIKTVELRGVVAAQIRALPPTPKPAGNDSHPPS